MTNFPTLPRFQFSLRWMFVVLTLVAVLLGFAFLGPIATYLLWLVVVLVIPTPLVILTLFDRGPRQTFAIGALLPWFVTVVGGFPGGSTSAVRLLLLLLAYALCGATAVATRIWLDRQSDR